MNLRPYQEHARSAIHREWKAVDKTLLVLPTGTGKTIVFANIAKDVVSDGGRVLILAHRGELLQQAADKLMAATGLGCAVEKAEEESHDSMYRVTVGSVQTLMRPQRLARFSQDHFTHVIIDEAHHVLASSYQNAAGYWAGAKILGVTATPDRNDRKNLGAYFDTLAYEYTLLEAIRDGYLSKIRALSIPLQIDLTKVRQQAGDFSASDLEDALTPYLGQIATEMLEHCKDRKTLVFTPLIATAKKFAALLGEMGLDADWVSGEDPNRAEKLKTYAQKGKGGVLVNSMLLTEGYDDPATDCIVCLRPTKSRPLYAQIVGRGTRISPGKENLLLLDFLWMTDKHELCRPAHLISSSSDEAAIITEMTQKAGGSGQDIDEDALNLARIENIRKTEEKLAEKLKAQRNRKRKLVDPLQWAVSVNASDLTDYSPDFGWEMTPPSEAQLLALEKAGISGDEITCSGMAAKLLDRLNTRRTAGFATPKQIRCLERYGFKHVGEMSFDKATKLITRLSANAWRLPEDLAWQVLHSK